MILLSIGSRMLYINRKKATFCKSCRNKVAKTASQLRTTLCWWVALTHNKTHWCFWWESVKRLKKKCVIAVARHCSCTLLWSSSHNLHPALDFPKGPSNTTARNRKTYSTSDVRRIRRALGCLAWLYSLGAVPGIRGCFSGGSFEN